MRIWLFDAACAAALGGVLGCSDLTEPPAPEPVSAGAAQVPSTRPMAAAAQSAIAPMAVPPPAPEPPMTTTTLVPGKGPAAQNGDTVRVHYTGTLTDGTKFDSSLDRNAPFDFVLGAGRVIRGWDQGVIGMKVGEKRKLVIPPSLAYGSRASPKIPANSTLVFEVQMLEINPQGPPR